METYKPSGEKETRARHNDIKKRSLFFSLCLCHYVPVMSLRAITVCCAVHTGGHKTSIYGDFCVFVTLPLCR